MLKFRYPEFLFRPALSPCELQAVKMEGTTTIPALPF